MQLGQGGLIHPTKPCIPITRLSALHGSPFMTPSTSAHLPARANPPHSQDHRLLMGLLVFASIWLLAVILPRNTPPLDNAEQWVWSQGFALGYYKHPPLPTWLAMAVQTVTGRSPVWISIMGAACVVGTLWLYARLLTVLRGRGFASLSVLAALCITYATLRLDFYNHNTVMMPLMAGIAWLMWRVAVAPSVRAWLGIGVLVGLGLLTKYQFVLVGACVALWWLRVGGWRERIHVQGAFLAVGAATLVFSPHVVWLIDSDWAPLHYASRSSLGAYLPMESRPAHVGLWVLDWLGNRLLPAWLLLIAAWLALRKAMRRFPEADDKLGRDLLLIMGWLPLVLMATLGLLTGMRLQFKWSTAFLLWTIPAVMVTIPAFSRSVKPSLWREPLIVGAFVLLQAALLGLQAKASRPCFPESLCPWSQRSFEHAAEAADAFSQAKLGGPVEILSGPYGVSGVMAQHLLRSRGDAPVVLIDGDLGKSPWLDEQTVAASRVVQVWPGCELPVGAERIMPGWYVTTRQAGVAKNKAYLQSDHWMIGMANGGGTYVECP